MDTTQQDAPPPRFRRLGSYEILSELGRGGMARVFRARHTGLGREVALKVILRSPQAGSEEFRRFQREMRMAARFSHPNLVQLFDCGIADGTSYIAMELVDGGSLSGLLGSPLSWHLSLAVLSRICDGLSVLHASNLLHRDIKPANILISRAGEIKLADFGLTASMDGTRITDSGALVGTPLFLPPEVLNGGSFTPAGDLWDVGLVLYELLTGRSPFSATSVSAALLAVTCGRILEPSRFVPGLPAPVERLQMELLSRDLLVRPTSAVAVREQAEELLASLGDTTWEQQLGPHFQTRCQAASAVMEGNSCGVQPPARELTLRQSAVQAETHGGRTSRRPAAVGLMVLLILSGLVALVRRNPSQPHRTAVRAFMDHQKSIGLQHTGKVPLEELQGALDAVANNPEQVSETERAELFSSLMNAFELRYYIQGATWAAELAKMPAERSRAEAERLDVLQKEVTALDHVVVQFLDLSHSGIPADEWFASHRVMARCIRLQLASFIQLKDATKLAVAQLDARIDEFLAELRNYLSRPHIRTANVLHFQIFSLGVKLRLASRPELPVDVSQVGKRLQAITAATSGGVPEGGFLAELFAWGWSKAQFMAFQPDGVPGARTVENSEDYVDRSKARQLLVNGLVAFGNQTAPSPVLDCLVRYLHRATRRKLMAHCNLGGSYLSYIDPSGDARLLRVKTELHYVVQAATSLRSLLIRSRRDISREPMLLAVAALVPAYQIIAVVSELQADFTRNFSGERLKVSESVQAPTQSDVSSLFAEFSSCTRTFIQLPGSVRNSTALESFLDELVWCSHNLFRGYMVDTAGGLKKLGRNFRDQLERILAEHPDAPRLMGWLCFSVGSRTPEFEPSRVEQETFLRYYSQVERDPAEAALTRHLLSRVLKSDAPLLLPDVKRILKERTR